MLPRSKRLQKTPYGVDASWRVKSHIEWVFNITYGFTGGTLNTASIWASKRDFRCMVKILAISLFRSHIEWVFNPTYDFTLGYVELRFDVGF